MTRLLYGIGATKAGTSWLHAHLSDHPQVAVPYLKEVHWFDTALHGKWERRQAILAERAARLGRRATDPEADPAHIAAMLEETERLHTLMDGRHDDADYVAEMERIGQAAEVVADITPAYATLGETGIARMAKAAPDALWVMVLRDPVARLWSNLSMVAGRRCKEAGTARWLTRKLYDEALAGKDGPATARGDYAGAIRALRAHVDPARVMLLFFETLFRQETIDALADFLGIARRPGDFARRVLAGSGDRIDEARAAAGRAFLAHQYDFVAAEVGPPPPGWRM